MEHSEELKKLFFMFCVECGCSSFA